MSVFNYQKREFKLCKNHIFFSLKESETVGAESLHQSHAMSSNTI